LAQPPQEPKSRSAKDRVEAFLQNSWELCDKTTRLPEQGNTLMDDDDDLLVRVVAAFGVQLSYMFVK